MNFEYVESNLKRQQSFLIFLETIVKNVLFNLFLLNPNTKHNAFNRSSISNTSSIITCDLFIEIWKEKK